MCCNVILLFNEVLTTHFQPKTGINLVSRRRRVFSQGARNRWRRFPFGVGFDGHALIGLNLQSIIFLVSVIATNGYAAIATALAISIATAVIRCRRSAESLPSSTSINRSALCSIRSACSSEIGLTLASVLI